MGYRILATEHTSRISPKHGLTDVIVLYKMMERDRQPNISDYLARKEKRFDTDIQYTEQHRGGKVCGYAGRRL